MDSPEGFFSAADRDDRQGFFQAGDDELDNWRSQAKTEADMVREQEELEANNKTAQ